MCMTDKHYVQYISITLISWMHSFPPPHTLLLWITFLKPVSCEGVVLLLNKNGFCQHLNKFCFLFREETVAELLNPLGYFM